MREALQLAHYGFFAATLGDLENARRAFTLALRDSRSDADVLDLFGCYLARCGRAREAFDVLQRAAARAPSCGRWVNAAEAALECGDLAAAVNALIRAVDLDPPAATPSGTRARLLALELRKRLREVA
jgi:Tfp pilus assembly protein PilF